ncbi:MAG: dipeptidase [Bacteroidia bacterium]|jgi:acetylornithine deacetylase/succinyl-diaminopimelate desuccinylase-like protein|nr:dipeptidase [Bacteroidia bacterium]MCC6767625.1 dipeptidase [Bacteroidia bacterium]
MSNYKELVDQHKDRFINELFELLRIPSVSADPKYKEDVLRMAAAVAASLKQAGAENVEVCPTPGYPIVYGEKIVDASLPTVLVYGHYDVQPADPIDLWSSPPFEPVIKDGKIYARGSCDDKGQMFMHVKAFELMMQSGALPCNIKFMIEGEEEVGSSNLDAFLAANRERLKADCVLVSDTSMIANDIPSITTGLRGLSYVEVEVTGPNRDLHSGVYGGGVANPVNVLCEMIASLKDGNKKITIPGFYADVIELGADERRLIAAAPFDEKEYMRELNIGAVEGETGYTTVERTSVRPTLDVNGIWGGYTGEGAKTVLPSKAYAKISMRLVPNQDPDKITELFKTHFESIAPASVKVEVRPHHGGHPAVTPVDSVEYQAAALAMEQTFGKKPVPARGGGSIPIVASFERILGLKTVLMGFGLDTDDIHSPNEHYGVFNFLKGIETIPYFHAHYAALKKRS